MSQCKHAFYPTNHTFLRFFVSPFFPRFSLPINLFSVTTFLENYIIHFYSVFRGIRKSQLNLKSPGGFVDDVEIVAALRSRWFNLKVYLGLQITFLKFFFLSNLEIASWTFCWAPNSFRSGNIFRKTTMCSMSSIPKLFRLSGAPEVLRFSPKSILWGPEAGFLMSRHFFFFKLQFFSLQFLKETILLKNSTVEAYVRLFWHSWSYFCFIFCIKLVENFREPKVVQFFRLQ